MRYYDPVTYEILFDQTKRLQRLLLGEAQAEGWIRVSVGRD